MSKKPSREMIWNHVQAIGTCMMVTHDGDGIRARPMRGIPRAGQNAIWFFASKERHPDIGLHRDACLTYVSLKDNVFVSLSGTMARVFDVATINGNCSPRVAVLPGS